MLVPQPPCQKGAAFRQGTRELLRSLNRMQGRKRNYLFGIKGENEIVVPCLTRMVNLEIPRTDVGNAGRWENYILRPIYDKPDLYRSAE